MFCALTVRKLKPGAYEDFRKAWGAEEGPPEGWTQAYHVRNVEDENEVIAFGFFDGTLDELRASQDEGDYAGYVERMAPFVESVGTDGIYEVVEQLGPGS